MYQIGQLIIYENAGVCEVLEVTDSSRCASLSGMPPEKQYYVLRPLFGKGVIYTPVNSDKAFTRPIITKEEADRLLSRIPEHKADAYYAQNMQTLKDHYRSAVKEHSCEALIDLTMSIYQKRIRAEEAGKKIGQVDERYMREAEGQLFGELSIALGIDIAEVPAYIRSRLVEVSDRSA